MTTTPVDPVAAEALRCVDRGFTRNCYGNVATAFYLGRFDHRETTECESEAFPTEFSDADLQSLVQMIAYDERQSDQLTSAITGAAQDAYYFCLQAPN